VPDLGVALQQLGREHDLVTEGGTGSAKVKEVLLGADGLQAERRLLAIVTR
jgi:hypothetical protein